MNRLPMSAAAAALLRALIARAGIPRDRILLTDVRSTDWQSLTLVGERHQLHLRIAGENSFGAAQRMCADLEDAEFHIHGHIVADIALVGEPARADDGSTALAIEALTIEE